jgi:hypothetical protein
MRKIKLLIAACALIIGAGQTWAQTDVTSTYITNADFEGKYSSYTNPKSDRDIYQPEGWAISYTNGNENDMTSLNSETTSWSNFSGKPQLTNGGTNVYWMRFRWGSNENVTLSQETSTNLPAGTYAVTVDAYSDDNTGIATISVAGVSQTVRSNGAWANYKVVFTLASDQKVTVSLSYTNTAADDQVAAFDNVKILDLNSEPSGISLKNVLGGTAASLSDFNVWYDDYTLEVEGTAGTEITVAADNISYTPEATGTVRFVKKDGIVYVYEGATYKTAVNSSKAAYVYSRTLSKDDPITGNYLENPSFETLGSSVGSNIYNIGTPWSSNVTMKSGGIRVGTGSAQHGSYVLVWRGSGNSNYFSQPISIPKNKGYKIFLQQIASGNANANFNIGLGNAAGDYSYLSTQIKLGTNNDGTKNAELGANGDMPEDVYFTFRNTSNNTASSGNDPVTQIDWIGLVGSDDFPITGVSSASYVYGTAYAPATAKSSYLAAKAAAETTIADATYNNVTGEERTNLQAAIDADVEDNDAAYNSATDNIQTNELAFTSALSHYQALIDAQSAVPTLAYASTSASAFKTAVATSASDADAKLAAMTTDIRAYYESHAMAEKVDGAVNTTDRITNATDPTNNDGWTWTGSKNNPANNEPWTDADGTNSHSYFDGGNWNGTNWTTTMKQTISLPAGKYLLTAKGRAATNTTLTMAVGEASVELPHVGSTGNVFDRGWGDASLEFTTDGNDVEIAVTATAKPEHEWFSISDFRLVRLELYTELADATTYEALNTAIVNAENKTLGFEAGEYAPYNNIDILNTLAEAKLIDQNVENAKDDVVALTNELNDDAKWTANATDVDAIYNGDFAVANGTNPKGWTRSNNGWGQQITGLTAETNGVNEGTTTAWYYNTNGAWEYGKDGVYTMPLAGNTKYVLTFKYRKHGGDTNNWMKTSVLNSENKGLEVAQYPGAYDGTKFQTATAYFTTDAAGNYTLSIEQNGNVHVTDVSLVKAASTNFTLDEENTTALPSLTFYETFTFARPFKAGWNAVCLPFATEAFDNAEIAEFDGEEADGDNVTLKFKKVDSFEANKPYLVYFPNAVASNKEIENVTVNPSEVKADGTAFDFMGTYTVAEIEAGNWVIADNKLSKASKTISLKPTRTYFAPKTTTARIAGFTVDGEEVTAIKAIAAEQGMNVEGVYNLKGQRVSGQLGKGIYVVNGKKVIK